jgi:hypothetical protein
VKDGIKILRAMRAEGFSGYKDLKLVDIPKPAVSDAPHGLATTHRDQLNEDLLAFIKA